jgi:4-hydroxybenzoate polyprenyltransferase
MKAWGKYFIAFNPIMDVYKSKKKGVRFIDKIVDKVYKVPTNDKELMNWGTIAMALRGSIFSIPLFTALAIYYNTWWIGLFFLPMLLQGLYYRGVTRYNFKYAEMLTGYTYGSLILISYLIGR